MSLPKRFHIILDFEHSKGGGTSFLSFLKSELIKKNLYTDKWYLAETLLINSHHLSKIKSLIIKYYPFKKFRIVHRIDGPMRVYNHKEDRRDDTVVWMNQKIAEATVFQSEWSRKEHEKLYGKAHGQISVISNVANPLHFKSISRSYREGKFKIISTVWSRNKNKGYETYQWLDEKLDYSQFSFELIGAPQGNYKNIRCLPYMTPAQLGEKLHEAHAFLFPSRYEACSNALLEALATGLPCITYQGSSNVEIIKDPHLWFTKEEEILVILNKMTQNYNNFLPKKLPLAEETTEKYIQILRG